MVRTFLKVYMELGSYFLFLQEQINDIIRVSPAHGGHGSGSARYGKFDSSQESVSKDLQLIQGQSIAKVTTGTIIDSLYHVSLERIGLPGATDDEVGRWKKHPPLVDGVHCDVGSRLESESIRTRIKASSAHLGVTREVNTHNAQERLERRPQLQNVFTEIRIRAKQHEDVNHRRCNICLLDEQTQA